MLASKQTSGAIQRQHCRRRHWPGNRAIAATLLLIAPLATAGDDFAGAVLECRALSSAEARLACYDRVVDGYDAPGPAAAATTPESVSEPAEPVSGRPDAESATPAADAVPAPDAETVFGLPPEADPRRTLEEIEATVVELAPLGIDKLAITLDNGHVWRQTSSSSLRLSVGDVVVIERASFGSHKLSKPGTRRSMKVRRIE